MPSATQRLLGKKALITGSNQGIGQGIAQRFAEEGADVVINYVSHPETANAMVDQIKAMGRNAVAIQADISKVSDVKNMISLAVSTLGGIDVLVNNAGIEIGSPFWEISEADYDRVVGIDMRGTFFVTQEWVKHRLAVKSPGRLINISSVHEDLPFPHFTTYCMCKGGLKMMMRNLSIELAPYNITVNNIAPGAIETPINSKLLHDPVLLKALIDNIPLGRLGKPADVSGAAVFLASDDANYVTGTTMVVDGGLLWNYSEQ